MHQPKSQYPTRPPKVAWRRWAVDGLALLAILMFLAFAVLTAIEAWSDCDTLYPRLGCEP